MVINKQSPRHYHTTTVIKTAAYIKLMVKASNFKGKLTDEYGCATWFPWQIQGRKRVLSEGKAFSCMAYTDVHFKGNDILQAVIQWWSSAAGGNSAPLDASDKTWFIQTGWADAVRHICSLTSKKDRGGADLSQVLCTEVTHTCHNLLWSKCPLFLQDLQIFSTLHLTFCNVSWLPAGSSEVWYFKFSRGWMFSWILFISAKELCWEMPCIQTECTFSISALCWRLCSRGCLRFKDTSGSHKINYPALPRWLHTQQKSSMAVRESLTRLQLEPIEFHGLLVYK